MDLAAVRAVLSSTPIQALFQAALLTANEGGHSLRELESQLGVSKSTLHRWISEARDRRVRNPRVELAYPPAGADRPGQKCEHPERFFAGRKRICLRCLLSNFENDPILRRTAKDVKPDPIPKPARFKPRGRKTA